MNNNEKKSLDTSSVGPFELNRIADMLERYANEYRSAAARLQTHHKTVVLTGLDSLENRAIALIRGNTNKLRTTIDSMLDAEAFEGLGSAIEEEMFEAAKGSEDPKNYVVDDSPDKPKRKTKKQAGKKA